MSGEEWPEDDHRGFYALLGVPVDADGGAIKSSYRKLAMKWHPDKNGSPEAEERFKEISNAYQVLSDPEKRDLVSRPPSCMCFALC